MRTRRRFRSAGLAIALGCGLAPGVGRAAGPDGAELRLSAATLRAQVAPDLRTVRSTFATTLEEGGVEVVAPAERYRAMPDPLPPHAERELFVGGFAGGGFDALEATVEGAECALEAPRTLDGARIYDCRGAEGRRVEVQSTLAVPPRHGPFSVRGRQLTLGGGWYGFAQPAGATGPAFEYDVEVTVPAGHAVVLGDRYFPAIPEPGARTVRWRGVARQVPLVVLPPWTGSVGLSGGAARFVSAALRRPDDPTARNREAEVARAVEEALAHLAQHGLPSPSAEHPLVVVEAPLRHDLARVTDGVVLVSERAFRLTPHERFLRFHRFPIVRALYTTWFLRGRGARWAAFDADAAGAFWRDDYVRAGVGRAEDAFDVLWLWSFIPAVDSLLYAPQLPFVDAYFRFIREGDPLRANLVDPPSTRPRGKVAYEKLLDRFGAAAISDVFTAVGQGETLRSATAARLGADGLEVLEAWSGAYPEVQYRLLDWIDRPAQGRACAPAARCFEVAVRVERTGAVVAEPLTVSLEDDDGAVRRVTVASSTVAVRAVTATLAAPLDLVILDPDGRLAETPTEAVPSPKYDNRSHPRWRVLLNSFNVLYSPSANNLDTAVDIGFSRRRDVRWRFATRASYAPEAITLSGRATYRFGRAITPDSLAQWVGGVVGGEYLRPEFAGTQDSAFAVSGALYYGYDDRRTAWAPEAGTGLRASLGISHTFGTPADDVDITPTAVNLTLRALRSWRIDARHQLSVRASVGAYLVGTPRVQLRYALGGRRNVRGYVVDAEVGRLRALASAEWVHPLVADMDLNGAWLVWITGLDGALYADVAVIGDDLDEAFGRPPRADIGYGARIYIDYFGVRPGVMAVDLAVPLVNAEGRLEVGPPAVYIDFAQSFFAF